MSLLSSLLGTMVNHTSGYLATGPAMREMERDLKAAMKQPRGSFFRIAVKADEVEAPAALPEPNDMDSVTSPCHPWEPIKVPFRGRGPFHCLLCGTRFAV